jgi:lysophospholipase L1-like esterase
MTELRICFFGDSIVHGTKDPTTLGWPGRLCAGAIDAGHDITMYNLGVRGETSEGVRRRWRDEAERRISPEMSGALAFAFGLNDSLVDRDGSWRVKTHRIRENARAVLSDAGRWLPTLMIGPAPVDDTRMPPQPADAVRWATDNERIRSVSEILADVATEADVPYLDVFGSFVGDGRWQAAITASDSIHPPEGYVLIAELVAAWDAWRRLLAGAPAADRMSGG